MNAKILLNKMEFGNTGECYNGCGSETESILAKDLLEEISWEYIRPKDDDPIELLVTDEDITKWLKNVEKNLETINYDDIKYLHIATVETDGGYDEFELEHYIEDE